MRYVSPVLPKFDLTKTVARYERSPDITERRSAEGGLRIQRKYKGSLPDWPLVSIITVCLNSAKTIRQTIESVHQQTYENIEYIIIDGRSTDDTVNIVRSYENAIDYYVSEPDGGLYAAMNKGIALATGSYLLVLNSDDWYEPNAVSLLVNSHRKSKVDFVSGRARNVDANGRAVGDIRSMPWDESIRLRMPLRHETMLIPRHLYDLIGGYDENYRIISDFKFSLGLFERGYKHYEVPEVIMNFRQTGVSSIALDKLTAERERLMRQQFPFLSNEDTKTLATHGRLSPEQVPLFLKRYPKNPELTRAIVFFVQDQKVAGAKKWLQFDANLLAENAISIPDHKINCNIRIATLCSQDFGGAGTGTQRRVLALRDYGINAHIYALLVKSKHNFVHKIIPNLTEIDNYDQDAVWQQVRERAIKPITKIKGFRSKELFSSTESVVNAHELEKILQDADIIHMHWIVGMLDYDNIDIAIGNKPVIWTLADMNPFTGGCHYSEGCQQYKKECESCHLLGKESNLAHHVWMKKKIAYSKLKNIHIVCPTRWIYDRAKASSLLGNLPCHHIPNAFPIHQFPFTNKLVARIKLGLPISKKFILFGADSLKNERKGGGLLRKALMQLESNGNLKDVEVIVFGEGVLDLPIPVHSLGYISDNNLLGIAYSAADVFVSPSIEDSGPMTVGEAMISGTPVVSFRVGIALEMIIHKRTGFIANVCSHEGLADGIVWALNADYRLAIRRSLECRKFAFAFHNPEISAKRHLKIYNLAMKNAS